HMGVGKGTGDSRVADAVKAAIESPLLETSINGAKAILLNIMGGYDLGMLEVNEAADQIEKAADKEAIVIFGASVREELKDEIIITVIATGFEEKNSDLLTPKPEGNATGEETEKSSADKDAFGGQQASDDIFKEKLTGAFDIPSFLNKDKKGF
ncbi:MAG: cell division protein FtsZ, partial [Anaerovorax sp.]